MSDGVWWVGGVVGGKWMEFVSGMCGERWVGGGWEVSGMCGWNVWVECVGGRWVVRQVGVR